MVMSGKLHATAALFPVPSGWLGLRVCLDWMGKTLP
jgi:hypothetical protein